MTIEHFPKPETREAKIIAECNRRDLESTKRLNEARELYELVGKLQDKVARNLKLIWVLLAFVWGGLAISFAINMYALWTSP